MRKKIIPFMLITLFAMTSSVKAFTDTDNHWAKESIDQFTKLSIVKGYEDKTFKPDNYMTRAEVATILNRMNGVTKESSKYVPDIARQDWYYSEIRKAIQSGIMNGDENGNTNPNNLITREEAIVMLSRAFAVENLVNNELNFKDENEISEWAKKEITTFSICNYINGYKDETIRPKNNITRAEFVTILNRIFDLLANTGIYSDDISGNVIIVGKNVVLNNIIINGDLIIPEGVKETFKTRNVKVRGNLILREKIDTDEISCEGKEVILYSEDEVIYDKYISKEYGIKFSIPFESNVIEKWNGKIIDYEEKDLLMIDIIESSDYYLKNIKTIFKEDIRNIDNVYELLEEGKIGNVDYTLYKDVTSLNDNNLLMLKRDNYVYKIYFYNITQKNLIDNVLGTIEFFDTDKVIERKNIRYKNSKLNLEFIYRDGYIGVDDSYNTNNIYSGDAPIKLFIQVNTITDINNYSFNEVVYMLKNLARDDGILKRTETLRVYNNDAAKMEIISEDKLMYSLYVVDGNILYKFLFMSEEEIIKEIGEDLFKQILLSIEF